MNSSGLLTVDVASVPVVAAVDKVASDQIIELANNPLDTGVSVRFVNAYSIACAQRDTEYLSVLRGRGLNYADGLPVAWYMHRELREVSAKRLQVRGPGAFKTVLSDGRATGLRHYFLGSTENTLDKLISRSKDLFPGIEIAGSWSPPFAPLDEDFYSEATRRIEAAAPDIVWVGLGTPKQDFAASELAARSGVLCAAVGAAFDFLAGTTSEAPKIFRTCGLEWFFRFAVEPRRLWRRYTIGSAQFIASAERGRRSSAPSPCESSGRRVFDSLSSLVA